MNKKYRVFKYSGGTYCGNGEFNTLDDCFKFADDGFCDYARIEAEGQTIKMHFTPKGE